MSVSRSLLLLLLAVGAALAPAPALAARRALVVGISDYTDDRVRDLRFATADARAVAAYLREDAAFEEVTVLLDREATREAIQTALTQTLARRVAPEDVVVVYFSGHGAPEADLSGEEPDGQRRYLVPADADPGNLLVTALDMRDVHRYLDWIRAGTVLFWVDACYAGGVGGRGLGLPPGTRDIGVASAALPTASGRAVLMASQPNQMSIELDALGHGLFTWALLEGLRGGADGGGDGRVTQTELYDWVQGQVSRAATKMGFRQDPVFYGSITGEIVLTGVARAPDAARERARLAEIEASVKERDAALTARRTLAAEALRVTRLADASAAVPVDEKVALWERFLADWRGEDGTADADQRLAWWRSAHTTFLDVDTDTAGAEVWLDGARRGTAPGTLTDVPIGRHRLVVSRTLYHPWQADVVVPTGGLRVEAALRPAFGTVEVTSLPPGAAVYLADVQVGKTPLTLREVRSGPLQVRLQRDGYEARQVIGEVTDGAVLRLHEALEPRFGHVEVRGAPAGATVSIGGRLVGKAPLPAQEVAAGEVEVRVEAAGRVPWSGRVSVAKGQVAVALVPPMEVRRGSLSVISEPRGATVLLDGRDVGTAPITLEGIEAGPHQLEVRSGALAWSGPVDVIPDAITTKAARLETARPGMLYVERGAYRTGNGAGGARQAELGAFWIDRTEVDNRRYHRCAAAGACGAPRARSALLLPDLPVVGVTWHDAKAYCAWAGGRLPTGAEWERAARGTDGRLYPWGSTWDPNAANWNDGGKVDGFALTASVEAFADHPSPAGALNMGGNALEWTSDAEGDARVVRGGSALMEGGPEGVKVTARFVVPAAAASEGIGFRCAATP